MTKIYIAPSNQSSNKYVYGDTTEAIQCQAIAKLIPNYLKDYDCEVKIGAASLSLQDKAKEATAWGANAYLSIHSNAGGGRGTEVWYDPNKEDSKAFAQVMYSVIAPISTGRDRGLKRSASFIDCVHPTMPSCIVEMDFHDWIDGAKWITENHETIAQAFAKGLITYLNISKKPVEAVEEAEEAIEIYRVRKSWEDADSQIGAYKVLANAIKKANANVEYKVFNSKGECVYEPKTEIKVGDKVKLKQGAKTYTGGNLASFVYRRNHIVKEIRNDRVVITYNGTVVAAVNKKDLVLV